MTTKPTLYIDPVGTLLIDGEHPNHFLEATVSPYAAPFMAWATKHFNVRWLTEQGPARMFHLAECLGLPGHTVPYASFVDAKSDGIRNPHTSFWVDTHLTPTDVSWIQQHGVADRFLSVAGDAGITEGHKEWLADKIKTKRR